MNTSGLKPVGRAVLVEPYEPEIRQGVIHIPKSVSEKTQMVEQRAIVVAVGEACWLDEPSPRAKVGDKVLISKYSGYLAEGPADGKQYRFINCNDIFGVITKEKARGR